MKLTSTEEKVLKYLRTYKIGTFDRIQFGVRFMNAIFSLMSKGFLVEVSRSSSMYDQRKGNGKTSYNQQVYCTAYTVRMSDNRQVK